jgi:hypothetical protein
LLIERRGITDERVRHSQYGVHLRQNHDTENDIPVGTGTYGIPPRQTTISKKEAGQILEELIYNDVAHFEVVNVTFFRSA